MWYADFKGSKAESLAKISEIASESRPMVKSHPRSEMLFGRERGSIGTARPVATGWLVVGVQAAHNSPLSGPLRWFQLSCRVRQPSQAQSTLPNCPRLPAPRHLSALPMSEAADQSGNPRSIATAPVPDRYRSNAHPSRQVAGLFRCVGLPQRSGKQPEVDQKPSARSPAPAGCDGRTPTPLAGTLDQPAAVPQWTACRNTKLVLFCTLIRAKVAFLDRVAP